jgi:hypothetical protein
MVDMSSEPIPPDVQSHGNLPVDASVASPAARARTMAPPVIKTLGYLISTVSVILLGIVSWSGAVRAGLTLVLILGVVASILGMGFRWYSYRLERQQRVR